LSANLNWTTLALGLAGGLALFLIGMDLMTQSLKALTGFRLQKILSKLSANRFAGAATGAITTAALQSSSITTVLTVGFVSAELFTLTQAASVIIGANLGTTVTAQIIALDIAEYSLGLLAVGAAFWLFASSRRYKQFGRAIAALGFVFFGLQIMSSAMEPLTGYQPLLEILKNTSSPLVAVVAGALVAALIQSSSATTGIVIVMSANGLVDLKTGIAIILGANIGTCVTALLATIGKDRNSLRAAMVHVVVNVSGVFLWLALLTPLTDLVQAISNETLEVASPRQLANAHTLFNVINTFIFLALLTPVVRLTKILVPFKETSQKKTDYLDKSALETPTLGLVAAQKQSKELVEEVKAYFDWGYKLASLSSSSLNENFLMNEIEDRKNKIRETHRKIVAYLAELSHGSKDDRQSQQILGQLSQVNEIIHLADHLASSFKKIIRRRLRSEVHLKPFAQSSIDDLQNKSRENLTLIYTGKVSMRLVHQIEAERALMADRFTKNKSKKKLDEFILESDLLDVIDRVNVIALRLNEYQQNSITYD
jgi:phosphate:Na+ symporter